MLGIYVYGDKESGWLDLNPGTILEMENLQDQFDTDFTAGEFSLPVEFPWTDHNRRILGFAERIENYRQIKNYWTIDVYGDGFPELVKAKITLLDKTGLLTYTKGSFTATISGTKGLFGSILKNKKLRDINLGDPIVWTDIDSRQFATSVMKGAYPAYNYIAFAPVAIESFFDTSKNYNDEFIEKDTVNYIIPGPGDLNDWKFGCPKPTDPAIATDPGTAEYINFRTIPFLKFKYVLQKAFESVGYTAFGEIIDNADFDDLYIFNNQSIDFFSASAFLDYTRKIIPSDHLPDILLVDFFKRVFNFFNIYPVVGATTVQLKYRGTTFIDRKILDITKYCDPNFKSSFQQVTDDSGYTIKYTWDQNDSMLDDRVKDRKDKNLVATVNTFADLETLDIGRDFTTDDIIYVSSENMYYSTANQFVVPKLWDAFTEGLDDYVSGDGGRTVDLGIGTLCTYVEFDETDALYERRNRLGCRMPGSYWTNKQQQVKSPFDFSVFYIKKTIIDGKNIPVSFNHNTSPAGTILEKYSLALNGPNAMGPQLHQSWQDLQEVNENVTLTINANKKLMEEIRQANTIQVQNVLLIPKKSNTTIPLQATIDMEFVPL